MLAWWYVNAAWREVTVLCAAAPQGTADVVESAFVDSPPLRELSGAYLAVPEEVVRISEQSSLDQLSDSDRAALEEAGSALSAPLTAVRLALDAEARPLLFRKHSHSISGALRITYFAACARGDVEPAQSALHEYLDYMRRLAMRDDLDCVLVIDAMTEKLFQMLERVRAFSPGHAAGMTAMAGWDEEYSLQAHLQRSLRAAESDIRQDICGYLADPSMPLNVRWLNDTHTRWQDYWPLRIIDMRNTLHTMARDLQRPWRCEDNASAYPGAASSVWIGPLSDSWNWTMGKMQEVVCRHAARREALTEFPRTNAAGAEFWAVSKKPGL